MDSQEAEIAQQGSPPLTCDEDIGFLETDSDPGSETDAQSGSETDSEPKTPPPGQGSRFNVEAYLALQVGDANEDEYLEQPLSPPHNEEFIGFITLQVPKQCRAVVIIDLNLRATTINTLLASEKAIQYPKAIYKAVAVFDTYCASFSPDPVPGNLNLTSIASSALYIAIKHEHGIELSGSDFATEMKMLRSLDFQLDKPTTKTFVDAYLCVNKHGDVQFQTICSYFTEIALLDRDLSAFVPSVIATACLVLGELLMDREYRLVVPPWYCPLPELRESLMILHGILIEKRHQHCQFSRNKYPEVHLRTKDYVLPERVKSVEWFLGQ